MNENSQYFPLTAVDLEFLQAARNQLLNRIVSDGGDVAEAQKDLFNAVAFDLKLGCLPIENRSDAEAFAVLVGDWRIANVYNTGDIQWVVHCQSNNREIVLRGMKNGRSISISLLADYLQKEKNLSYFRFRLNGFLTGVMGIDDPISSIDDILCRCGSICRSDSFRPGAIECEHCKLKWFTVVFGQVRHDESAIGATSTVEYYRGQLARVTYPEDKAFCNVCGEVYDPLLYDACPGLLWMAIEMLEPSEDIRALFPMNEKKALDYLFAHKSQLRTLWTANKPVISKRILSNLERTLDRVGLLSEIQ